MRGYFDIVRSTTACVHFVFETKLDDEFLSEIKEQLKKDSVLVAYVDARDLLGGVSQFCRVVGAAIGAHRAIKCMEESYVLLFDEMVSLSNSLPGLVLIVDRAWEVFDADQITAFGFVEGFLSQLHHWLGRGRPCHLCFQMTPNEDVKKYFLNN